MSATGGIAGAAGIANSGGASSGGNPGTGGVGLGGTVAAIGGMTTYSTDACQQCTAVSCEGVDYLPPYPGCDALQGVALDGPSVGLPKSQLCWDVWNCVTTSNCITTVTTSVPVYHTANTCYCNGVSCYTVPDGPCVNVINAGLETTDISFVAMHMGDTSLAAGVAMAAVQCSLSNYCTVCPYVPKL
jgi:hypothetical protein